eukprot:jgi/Chrzof1/5611/Cz16g08320.t1
MLLRQVLNDPPTTTPGEAPCPVNPGTGNFPRGFTGHVPCCSGPEYLFLHVCRRARHHVYSSSEPSLVKPCRRPDTGTLSHVPARIGARTTDNAHRNGYSELTGFTDYAVTDTYSFSAVQTCCPREQHTALLSHRNGYNHARCNSTNIAQLAHSCSESLVVLSGCQRMCQQRPAVAEHAP